MPPTDVGFGNTKYVVAASAGRVECSHFPSIAYFGFDDKSLDSMGTRRRTVAPLVDGLYYEVGPEVELASDRFRSRQLHDGFTETPEYRALLAGALGFMKVDAVDLLVLGLPVAQYMARKATLERLSGEVLDMTPAWTFGKRCSRRYIAQTEGWRSRRARVVRQEQPGKRIAIAGTDLEGPPEHRHRDRFPSIRGLVYAIVDRQGDPAVCRKVGDLARRFRPALSGPHTPGLSAERRRAAGAADRSRRWHRLARSRRTERPDG